MPVIVNPSGRVAAETWTAKRYLPALAQVVIIARSAEHGVPCWDNWRGRAASIELPQSGALRPPLIGRYPFSHL